MRREEDKFVKNYQIGQRGSIVRHTPFETLRPLSISETPKTDTCVNFVAELH